MSVELAQVNRLLGKPVGDKWPETFNLRRLAILQAWADGIDDVELHGRSLAWESLIQSACNRGELEHQKATKTILIKPGKLIDPSGRTYENGDSPILESGGQVTVVLPEYDYKTIRHIAARPFAKWLEMIEEEPSTLVAAWFKSQGVAEAKNQPKETAEQRQDRRLQMCIDAGLKLPTSHLGRLPDGIGKLAQSEGVKRQTFSEDVRAALARKLERERPKPRLVSSNKR
jgi:hypothetical protein